MSVKQTDPLDAIIAGLQAIKVQSDADRVREVFAADELAAVKKAHTEMYYAFEKTVGAIKNALNDAIYHESEHAPRLAEINRKVKYLFREFKV